MERRNPVSRRRRTPICVGCRSFPGDVIARERDLEVEMRLAGRSGAELEGYVPPCSYSSNAFGRAEAPSASNPPDFFFDGARRHEWTLPPATVSVWPYEAMYAEEVKAEGYLDNSKRRALTLEFFSPLRRIAAAISSSITRTIQTRSPRREPALRAHWRLADSEGRQRTFLRERLGRNREALRRRHDLGARHQRSLSRRRRATALSPAPG